MLLHTGGRIKVERLVEILLAFEVEGEVVAALAKAVVTGHTIELERVRPVAGLFLMPRKLVATFRKSRLAGGQIKIACGLLAAFVGLDAGFDEECLAFFLIDAG